MVSENKKKVDVYKSVPARKPVLKSPAYPHRFWHDSDMKQSLLPPDFADLEPFIDWALDSETERLEKRLTSSMEDIQAFYSAVLGRIDEALEYLNGFPLEQLPEAEQRLLNMTLALAEVWVAVELYKRPDHPFGLDMRRFVPGEANSVPPV